MVCENQYSKKEILVFEGFIKLVDEDVSLNSIKVADIAKSAGIGKGTVYEYFNNKEEVIAKAIFYKMHKDFSRILLSIENAKGFENKCKLGFQEILEVMSKGFDYFQMLITNKEIHNVFKGINHGKDEMIEFRDYVIKLLDPIVDLGLEEGIINPSHDIVYVRSVFISVYSGLSTIARFQFKELTKEDISVQKKIAYTMLIKSLS